MGQKGKKGQKKRTLRHVQEFKGALIITKRRAQNNDKAMRYI
jgi:hypothetical protein